MSFLVLRLDFSTGTKLRRSHQAVLRMANHLNFVNSEISRDALISFEISCDPFRSPAMPWNPLEHPQISKKPQ
jgi:hypothetical protein